MWCNVCAQQYLAWTITQKQRAESALFLASLGHNHWPRSLQHFPKRETRFRSQRRAIKKNFEIIFTGFRLRNGNWKKCSWSQDQWKFFCVAKYCFPVALGHTPRDITKDSKRVVCSCTQIYESARSSAFYFGSRGPDYRELLPSLQSRFKTVWIFVFTSKWALDTFDGLLRTEWRRNRMCEIHKALDRALTCSLMYSSRNIERKREWGFGSSAHTDKRSQKRRTRYQQALKLTKNNRLDGVENK